MLAVVRVDVVGRFEAGAETDDCGLFAEIEMAVATDACLCVHFAAFFLKVADKHHLIIIIQERRAVFLLGNGGRFLIAGRCPVTRMCLLFAVRVQVLFDPFCQTVSL
jgi:hypothetical protein